MGGIRVEAYSTRMAVDKSAKMESHADMWKFYDSYYNLCILFVHDGVLICVCVFEYVLVFCFVLLGRSVLVTAFQRGSLQSYFLSWSHTFFGDRAVQHFEGSVYHFPSLPSFTLRE